MYPCGATGSSHGNTLAPEHLSAPEMIPLSNNSCGFLSGRGLCCGTYCAVRTGVSVSVCACACVW